jgi:hypothetical protein
VELFLLMLFYASFDKHFPRKKKNKISIFMRVYY